MIASSKEQARNNGGRTEKQPARKFFGSAGGDGIFLKQRAHSGLLGINNFLKRVEQEAREGREGQVKKW